MKKYYIGILIISLITLGLTGYVVVQAASSKQDNETSRKAQEIATKLNKYVDKSGVPKSLDEAGIKDVPSTISYTKQSEDTYEFCVTYKRASDNYGGGFDQILTGSIQSQLSGMSSYDEYESSYTPSSLYLPYSHKAGKNCQKVETYSYSSSYDKYDYPSTFRTPSTSTTNALDTERQTDIKALHGQLEAYYATKGFYPTLANLNDATWRATNLKGLDKEALKDPNGTGYTLAATYGKNIYSYEVESDSGKECNNTTVDCTYYILEATLSTGESYSKYSLN